jgi:hypothetical protein
MLTYTGQGLVAFFDTFKSDMDCLQFLSDRKWNPENGGFKCSKCGHNKYTIRSKNLARDCRSCHHVESPTAGTLFHRVKFGVRKAFVIVYEMSTKSRGVSATQMAAELDISRPTAWLFMHKVRTAMASRETSKISAEVQVKAFAYGWKEDFRPTKSRSPRRKKLLSAIEINNKGCIVQAHFKHINNYSYKELSSIFESHISNDAVVVTEKWSGFKPLESEYNIVQKSGNFQNFIQTNRVVHHMKTWLRSTYTWMHEHHMQRYLDEFSFKMNRSIHKENIFDSLIRRMLTAKPLKYGDIKIRT